MQSFPHVSLRPLSVTAPWRAIVSRRVAKAQSAIRKAKIAAISLPKLLRALRDLSGRKKSRRNSSSNSSASAVFNTIPVVCYQVNISNWAWLLLRGSETIHLKFKIMFGLFKGKSEKDKLEKKYRTLLDEAYQLSHRDRTAADRKTAEAEAVLQQIEALNTPAN